jgi:hypothetical protein
MRRTHNQSRGFLLVIAAFIMVIISVLTAVYLSTIVGEKTSVDSERVVLQTLNFAEGGANKVFAQLRSAVMTSVANFDAATKTQQESKLATYTSTLPKSLQVFNTTGVTVNATCAVVKLDSTALSEFHSSLNGLVNATAVITPAENVTEINDVYYFKNYTCTVSSDAVINYGNRAVQKRVTFAPVKFTMTARQANFAKYALFTFRHQTSSGTTVWFTGDTNFYGPVHTNERFSFANNPSAHFTNEVSQTNSTARFYNNGNSILVNASYNGVRDVPVFDAGFTRSQDPIPLPSSVTQTEMRSAALGTMSAPSSAGVYVPYTTSSGVNTLSGGIYIYGNPSGTSTSDNPGIAMAVNGSTNNSVYTITQRIGWTDHTTVVTVNYNHSPVDTTVTRDGVSTTYVGKPDGSTHEGIVIYSNDEIKSLSGTVERNTDVTVAGEKDVVITGNVLYQDYSTSPTLNATGYTNMLGIMSWGGNIRVGSTAPDDVSIHAVVMAPAGVFTVDNYDSGSSRGTATLLGGVISYYYGAFGTFSGTSGMRTGYGRNFIYDARVLAGQTPPYFPYMDKFSFDDVPFFSWRPVWKEEES